MEIYIKDEENKHQEYSLWAYDKLIVEDGSRKIIKDTTYSQDFDNDLHLEVKSLEQYDAELLKELKQKDQRIAELEEENKHLKFCIKELQKENIKLKLETLKKEDK